MADLVVSEGYAAVGYEYINVDDCWLEKERNYKGELVPDRTRFPYGMKSLADYVSIFNLDKCRYTVCGMCFVLCSIVHKWIKSVFFLSHFVS